MRLMSVVRSAALAVACLFPVSAAAAPDPLPEGLFDFSITYPDSMSGGIILSILEAGSGSFSLSGVMTLDGTRVTAFSDVTVSSGNGSASLGNARLDNDFNYTYTSVPGGTGNLDVSGVRFSNSMYFQFFRGAAVIDFFTSSSGFTLAAYDYRDYADVRASSSAGGATLTPVPDLTPVPEIDGGRLSLALFVLATIGVAIAARRRRGGSEGVSHGPLATA
jgi:hypothetical protein